MKQELDKRAFLLTVLTNPGRLVRVEFINYEAAHKALNDEIRRLESQTKVLQEALDSMDTT